MAWIVGAIILFIIGNFVGALPKSRENAHENLLLYARKIDLYEKGEWRVVGAWALPKREFIYQDGKFYENQLPVMALDDLATFAQDNDIPLQGVSVQANALFLSMNDKAWASVLDQKFTDKEALGIHIRQLLDKLHAKLHYVANLL